MPSSDHMRKPDPQAGAGEPVMYVDYDGAVHHEAVYWDAATSRPFLRAPARYCLFQHAPLLEQLMAPHPSIAIVLSTSWVQHYGLRKAARELPLGLRRRVIGSVYDARVPGDGSAYLSRGEQVSADVLRRRPGSWLALDDDPVGWPEWSKPHVLLTDPYEGISPPHLLADLRRRIGLLAALQPPSVFPTRHP